LREAFDIATAPESLARAVPFAAPDFAGTLMWRPVWLVNETPVIVQPGWVRSAVI
jgi:hypothetical protein